METTILIVDDSQTAIPGLRAALEGAGYRVVTAFRAEEALELLSTLDIDLVITEILLPGMDGLEFIRHIRALEGRESLPIVVLTVRSAPEDYALAFSAGANEYFVKPVDGPKLQGIVAAQLMRRQREFASQGSLVPRPAARKSEKAEIITVFGLKGGVGTSTIAINVAVAVKRLVPSARVGLIDLSLEEGIDALMLDIVPTSTMFEWARENVVDATPNLLNQYFVPHRTGIGLLAAPPNPEQAEVVRPEIVRRTLELARQAFDYLVIDTASTFHETTLIALESADTLILPLTPDMAALKATVSTIKVLKAMGVDESKFRIVLNEIIPRAGLTKEQVEGSVRQPVFALPHAGAAFIEASNHGMPVTAENEKLPAARALYDLARTVCEPEQGATDAQRAKPGGESWRTMVDRLRPRRT